MRHSVIFAVEHSQIGSRQSNMAKLFRTLVFWTLIICACSSSGFSAEAVPTAFPNSNITPAPSADLTATYFIPTSTTEGLPSPKLIATLSTPHIDQGPDGANTVAPSNPQDCGYQWAQETLPELSSSFQKSIQNLQPEAQANAFAFGENCVHSDGTVAFIPMETDFNITLQISDLSNESDLGKWIVKVMQVIENIPSDQIVGPRPGRVSIIFQSRGEQSGVNFYVNGYQALPAGLSNAEIYQALQTPQ